MKRYLPFAYPGLLLWALGLLAVGCHTDTTDELLADRGTASITLHVPQAETRTPRTTEAEYQAVEKRIRTLRVLVFVEDQQIINTLFDEADLSNGTVTLDRVPVGTVTLYAIANESALGKDYSDPSAFEIDMVNGVPKAVVEDLPRANFPKRFSELDPTTYSLPMCWLQRNLEVKQPDGTPQVIEVALERSVAKLNIIMSNTLSQPITITSMSFGSFFGDHLYLFRESTLDIPASTSYATQLYENLAIQIDQNSSLPLVCYIYPSYAWSDASQSTPYTIGFTTTTATYNPVAFINRFGGSLNSIPRNTQVNIYATLSAESNLNVSFDVTDWDTPVEIPVPPFN